jgi:polyribonucleotide nucleotidyltransferase
VGQKVQVEITKVDDRGKLSLSPVVADEQPTEDAGIELPLAEGDDD